MSWNPSYKNKKDEFGIPENSIFFNDTANIWLNPLKSITDEKKTSNIICLSPLNKKNDSNEYDENYSEESFEDENDIEYDVEHGDITLPQ